MYTSCHKQRPLSSRGASSFLCLTIHISPFSPLPPFFFWCLCFPSRTGGHTGARDRFTCRNECRRVCLGFPLCCSSAEGLKIELHLELSLNVPQSPVPPPPSLSPTPPFSSTEGRRKWNSLITNPSLWTKRICINPGAIESLHKTHNHINPPLPPPPKNPSTLNSFSRSNRCHHLFLPLSHTQSFSLFLSPRMPCRSVWLGTSLLTLFTPHYYHWADVDRECILMIIMSVINEKIDNLTTGRSFM